MTNPCPTTATPLVKIISLNARRLNIPERCSQLLLTMHRDKADVIFLQEIHFRSDSTPKLFNYHFPTVYHATNSNAKSKGVSVLIAKNCPLQISDSLADAEGRYLILKGTYLNHRITLPNIYAPNIRHVSFFRSVAGQFASFKEGTLILGETLMPRSIPFRTLPPVPHPSRTRPCGKLNLTFVTSYSMTLGVP